VSRHPSAGAQNGAVEGLIFSDILQKALKNEKNPINRMYLNEINIKWKKVELAAEDFRMNGGALDTLITALNEFSHDLQNPKYHQSIKNKGGFRGGADIFSAGYLDDLLNILMGQHPITGASWGYQKFSTHFKFYQKRLLLDDRPPTIEYRERPRFLMLAQQMDLQFRLAGRRNFTKYELQLPIIVFHTFHTFGEEDFIRVEYFARLAKQTFELGKTLVVTETLSGGFIPDVSGTGIDGVFVLCRPSKNGQPGDLAPEVVKLLDRKINNFLHEREADPRDILKTGYID